MKYRIRKKPLLELGGKPTADPFSPASLFSPGQQILDTVSPQKQNADFMSRGYGKSLTREKSWEQGRQQLEKVGAMAGPVGLALSASSAVGRAVDNATKDEFGIYRSKGAQMLDMAFDPIGNIQDLITADWKNLNWKSAFTGDPFGEQAARKQERDLYKAKLQSEEMIKNEQTGNLVRSMTPVYQAPAYGRRGMKFRMRNKKY